MSLKVNYNTPLIGQNTDGKSDSSEKYGDKANHQTLTTPTDRITSCCLTVLCAPWLLCWQCPCDIEMPANKASWLNSAEVAIRENLKQSCLTDHQINKLFELHKKEWRNKIRLNTPDSSGCFCCTSKEEIKKKQTDLPKKLFNWETRQQIAAYQKENLEYLMWGFTRDLKITPLKLLVKKFFPVQLFLAKYMLISNRHYFSYISGPCSIQNSSQNSGPNGLWAKDVLMSPGSHSFKEGRGNKEKIITIHVAENSGILSINRNFPLPPPPQY